MTRHPRRHERERGSISLFAIVIVVALLLIVGLVVDGGGKIRATQAADQIAREAARQAGQAMGADAIRGEGATVDPAKGKDSALNYLAAAGAKGTVTIGGTRITVEAQLTYQPIFLSVIGIGPMTVTGVGEARATRVEGGQER